ncbi:hypothetical protein FRC10_001039 [Ceratobasidium sp. 414]|nr:hypothetical protein FRC10_001039 [Ceratobasidium sp. 414]
MQSKVIRLSNLKFAEHWTNDPTQRSGADLRFAEQESAEPRRIDTFAPLSRTTETRPYGPQETPVPTPPKFKYGDLKDGLSKDTPGCELSNDATVWKLYLDEAEEYDQELVKGRHASLDVLLLFAALFSAILTTFLVDSKNLLQADPASTSVALLLLIAQNQAGASPDTPSTIQIPPFTPATSALWINGLWFVALALSLAAALIVMLSKEWLTAYTASRPRPAHPHALLRQARLDGLDNWWALHIIALLPTLLHLALLLFALGLVVYLWTLEIIVAAVTGAVVALTLLFYLGSTTLGAVFPYCPFVTQISMYVRRMGGARVGSWLRVGGENRAAHQYSRNHHGSTTLEDMRAVSWLAENARDPVAIDCAYQALAGIQIPEDVRASRLTPTKHTENWYQALEHIFPTLLTRLGAILNEGRELAASRGANAARYSRALTELASFLGPDGPGASKNTDEQPEKNTRPRLDSLTFPSFSDSQALPIRRRAEQALEVLDGVWRDEHPAFSADTFACLTGAEFRLTALAADSLTLNASPAPSTPGTPRFEPMEEAAIAEQDATGAQPGPNGMTLASLQRTYARSLVRASVQLRYHWDGRTPIGPFALAYLLDAMRTSAKCVGLNPGTATADNTTLGDQLGNPENDLLSPSYHPKPPAESSKSESQLNFIIPVFSFEHYLRPTDLARGPLGSVIRVLGTTSSRGHGSEALSGIPKDSGLRVRMAAARALAALAPVILKRWMAIKIPKSGRDPNASPAAASTLDFGDWPDVDSNLDIPRLENAIAAQLLLVIRTLGPHLLRGGAISLVEAVLAELNRIVVTTPYSAYLALRNHAARDLSPLLEFASGTAVEGHATLSSTAKAHIVSVLTFEISGKQQPRRTYLQPRFIPHLLRVLRDASSSESTTKVALKYIVDRVRDTNHNVEHLRSFTHSDQGYSSLVAIGLVHEEHIESVVNSILQITHVAVASGNNARNTPVILSALAVPGFLDAISLVARHTVKMIDRQNHRHLHTFGRNMMTALHRVEPSAARIVLEHGALDEVIAGLQVQQARSNSGASGSGSGSGTGRANAPSTDYLLAQLRTLKEERLPELAARYENEGEDERGPRADLTGQAI